MELTTKPDFQRCLDRIEAWWDRQVLDRPPVTLHVRSGRRAREIPAHHAALRDRWLDVEYRVDCAEADVEAGEFLAETFPRFMPNLGPEICATAYGADLVFSENTSWSTPVARSIRDVLGMQPDLETFYWSVIRRMTDLSIQRGSGRWITAVTDLHTQGDLLAALRDPQALALDFADDFEGVRLACRHVTPHFDAFYDDLVGRTSAAGLPCCTWGVAVSRRRMYYSSCDFICMISPGMFAETILPAVEYEIGRTQRNIFHLDGPGALKHLDALLAIPDLNAIQWVYGAGATTARDWIDLYRRIQSAGKAIEVAAADMAEARTLMEHLRPEGVWLCVGGSYSRDEARAFLSQTERWARGGR